jgi:hydrogenase maturation protein HypF
MDTPADAGLRRFEPMAMPPAPAPPPPRRRRLEARGLVQGVGCRPFVYRLATELRLAGFVLNHAAGVTIEIEGPADAVAAFETRLPAELPPPGRLASLESAELAPTGEPGFRIADSAAAGATLAWVLPDLATCAACRVELFDTADRRGGYAFINCTHCGPRFTIIADVPYDRARTTMAGFTLCADCRREYQDPADRRFHAQPNACPECGPALSLLDAAGGSIGGEPLAGAAALLTAGGIVAVKGLGGYHLAVDAADGPAVARLRARKQREAKPLAVMAADLAAARAIAEIDDAAAALLASPAAPIVLLSPRPGAPLAAEIAPGQTTVGLLLAYTPLHHLLLAAVGRPLVMTSGNLSDEPIAHRDDDALARLGGIADAFLTHNRPIQRRCDDSVVRLWRGAPLPLRRSRGYAPQPLDLDDDGPEVILAAGGHQKNTFCLTRGREAYLSHHIGDLENDLALGAYETGIADFERLFDLAPTVLAYDPHPDYLATRYALERAEREGLEAVAVQHHHAHIAACLADNGRHETVLGLAWDGTGWGPDGSIWGGEWLLADRREYRRAARLRPLALAGGAAAVRQGWRVALELARQAGVELTPEELGVEPKRAAAVRQMLERGFQCVATSSVGRLFDGFAALCGVASESRYEGQAAVLLEGTQGSRDSADGPGADSLPFEPRRAGGLWELDWRPAVVRAVELRRAGAPAGRLAGAFHRGLALGAARLTTLLREETGCVIAALSGGCFQNVTLLELLAEALQAEGFEVLTHRRVPPNDGGLSLGQAAVARARRR